MRHEEYVTYDAVGLAELIREGQVTPEEVIEAANRRIDAVNSQVNAVVHRISPAAPASETGPFAGVPFLLKDMETWIGGYPATHGSRSLRTWVPYEDSELVRRYRAAGLRVIGKTNCPEFGGAAVTEPELHGPTRNPWNLAHSPCGSSGGSAAAVAAGMTPVASAGDGGGSIRMPASACGLFGLKTSRGLVPLAPEGNPGLGNITRHVLTRTVRDSAAALDISTDPMIGEPYVQPRRPRSYSARLDRPPKRLRVGVSRTSLHGEALHPDCEAAVDQAVELLESLGHRVVELDLPVDPHETMMTFLTIGAAIIAADIHATKARTGAAPRSSDFEPSTRLLSQIGESMSARDLYEAQQQQAMITRSVAMALAGVDVHLSATLTTPPPRVGQFGPTLVDRLATQTLTRLPSSGVVMKTALSHAANLPRVKMVNTYVFNLTGQPAMNVPISWNGVGLPIGVQIAADLGQEELLLRLAQQVSDARPWTHRLEKLAMSPLPV
jgi:amidase